MNERRRWPSFRRAGAYFLLPEVVLFALALVLTSDLGVSLRDLAILGAGAVALLIWWLLRVARFVLRDRSHAVRLLSFPVLVLASIIAIRSDLGFRIRFAVSRTALEHYIDQVSAGRAAGTWDAPDRVRLVFVHDVEPRPSGIYLHTGESLFWDSVGVIYSGDGVPEGAQYRIAAGWWVLRSS